MFLSRIKLDITRLETMRALASPSILHGSVESGFPHCPGAERERSLWRIDYLGGLCYLLVLSHELPDYNHISEQFGYPQSGFEIKNYSALIERLDVGQKWRFRLCANPVKSSWNDREESGRGKIHAHVTQEQQHQWLQNRAPACGFSLESDEFGVVNTEWKKFRKACGNEVTLRTVAYEGVLSITDLDAFKNSLFSGIGRAKAYGCGLMTLARLTGNGDG